MKIVRLFIMSVLVAALTACATHPHYNDKDAAAIKPMISAYHTCLNTQASQVVNGSEDVRLLTHVVLRDCNSKLQPIGNYLKSRGFANVFISQYLSNLHGQAGDNVESFLLHVKSKNATQNAASAGR